MTIEEFLEQEEANGRILQGGGPASSDAVAQERKDQAGLKEDDTEEGYRRDEEETIKARVQDEWRDTHRKGEGNMCVHFWFLRLRCSEGADLLFLFSLFRPQGTTEGETLLADVPFPFFVCFLLHARHPSPRSPSAPGFCRYLASAKKVPRLSPGPRGTGGGGGTRKVFLGGLVEHAPVRRGTNERRPSSDGSSFGSPLFKR